jgi:hypothetical protein
MLALNKRILTRHEKQDNISCSFFSKPIQIVDFVLKTAFKERVSEK